MSLTAERLADIAGLVADDTDNDAWLAREGIELTAIEAMFASIERNLHKKVAEDGDVVGAVIDLTGQAFRLGWECAKTRVVEL